MTVLEALTRADLLRPNALDPALKLYWLSALDGRIHSELLQAHSPADDGPQPGPALPVYDESTELERTSLLVPPPYDELYPCYLVMRIDLEHGELDRYNNDAAAFNRLWQSWAALYCRTHAPKGVPRLRF